MNKKEFLSILEKRLSILNEDERNDIINEYKDTISEKVKNGQTEEEAIKDFGNIDDLVKELLSAYKLNPEFDNKEKGSFDSILEESEGIIRRGANKLASVTKNIYHRFEATNKDINLSLIFEILIKIFLVVLALAVLRLPFILVEELGKQIFEAFFSPVNEILSFAWSICLMVLYLIFCILIAIATFKQYFSESKEPENINKKKDFSKESTNKKGETIKENKKVQNEREKHTTIGDVCLLIVKIWVVLAVIIPLAFLDGCALFGLILACFYFFKGINLLGLIVLLIGCIVLATYLIKLLFNLVFSKKKITFIPAVIGVVLVTVGSIMFFDMIMNIKYIDGSPLEKEEAVKEEVITIKNDALLGLHYNNSVNKVVDNTMVDNEVKVKVTYDKNIHDLLIHHDEDYEEDCDEDYYDEQGNYVGGFCDRKLYDYISINLNYSDTFNDFKEKYDSFIDNLKDNKVYSYSFADKISIEITANEKTLQKIKYE